MALVAVGPGVDPEGVLLSLGRVADFPVDLHHVVVHRRKRAVDVADQIGGGLGALTVGLALARDGHRRRDAGHCRHPGRQRRPPARCRLRDWRNASRTTSGRGWIGAWAICDRRSCSRLVLASSASVKVI